MIALAQALYEIALSYKLENEQVELEQQHMDWGEAMVASCTAEGVLEEILSDRIRAREPVRCLADKLFLRIHLLDEMVADLAQ